eukprot:gb/GECG01013602.1/.p1 GENE.gb/GECG01013602.1/~~gb/GECG01013602.1/.p1  ORF type:complete len:810 (+),score=155.22 gb/GECG01013602.1/:1-2430(+)
MAAVDNPMAASVAAEDAIESAADTAERFSHLLQPIRDLAENWNIDVARELEDYLEELESLTISLPDGKTNLNFAEAALLIQGSACIYSRKVEYLYNLIYKTLETISHQKKKEKRPASTLEEEEADLLFDAREQFLLLDDVVKESNNVDMKENPNIYENIAVAASTDPRKTPKAPGTHQNLINKTPLSMMATQGGDTAGKQTFRLASTSIHQSGALLPEPSYAELLTNQQPEHPARVSNASSLADLATGNLFEGASGDHQYASVEDLRDDDAGADDDSMGGGDIPLGEDDLELPQDTNNYQAAYQGNAHQEESRARVGRSRALSTFTSFSAKQQQDDPWEELDPYDTGSSTKLRPHKTGKTFDAPKDAQTIAREGMALSLLRSKARKRLFDMYKENSSSLSAVIPDVETLTSTKVKKAIEELDDETLWKFSGVSQNEINEASSVFTILGQTNSSGFSNKWSSADFPAAPTQVSSSPFFPTLKSLFADHLKMKKSLRLKNIQDQKRNQRAQDEEELESLPVQDYDDGVEDDDFGVFDDTELQGVGEDFQVANEGHQENEAAANGGQGDCSLDSTTEVNGTTVTYEELVREHINKYIKTAEKRINDSNLNQSVNDWRDRIQPMLDLEKTRAEFDIYECGDTVLDKFHEIEEDHSGSSVYHFREVTNGCEQYEVCRMFLATLQLANEGAVDFFNEQEQEETTDGSVSSNIKLQLISDTRHRESAEGYGAHSSQVVSSVEEQPGSSSGGLAHSTKENKQKSNTGKQQRRKRKGSDGKENTSRKTKPKVAQDEAESLPVTRRTRRSQEVEYAEGL